MLIVGRLIGKVDGRYLIAFGFLILAASTNVFTNLTLEIAQSNVMIPMIFSGFAMGFVFVPLTTIAMGTLSNEQISNASGIYNLMRNMGGSIGIAAMTAFLTRGGQIHQNYLSGSLNAYSPQFQELVQNIQNRLGVSATIEQAYGVVYGMLLKQSMLLSYIDNFRLLAFLCLICVPAAFLFKKVSAPKGPVAVH